MNKDKPKQEEPKQAQSKPKEKLSDFDKIMKKAIEFNPKKKKK